MNGLADINNILNNMMALYFLALGIWAGILTVRGKPLSGQFWGAMWLASIPPALGLVLGIVRALDGEQLRAVFWLYQMYFVIVLPGTFALLKGRDDRNAAMWFAGVCIFSALTAIALADPSRHVIVPAVIPTLNLMGIR